MFRGTKETLLIRWCSWCKSTAEKEEFAISAEEKKTRVSWAMVCVCFERQANIINIISFGGGYVFSLRSLKTRDQQRQPWRCLNYCSPVPSFQEWQEGRHRSADKWPRNKEMPAKSLLFFHPLWSKWHIWVLCQFSSLGKVKKKISPGIVMAFPPLGIKTVSGWSNVTFFLTP